MIIPMPIVIGHIEDVSHLILILLSLIIIWAIILISIKLIFKDIFKENK